MICKRFKKLVIRCSLRAYKDNSQPVVEVCEDYRGSMGTSRSMATKDREAEKAIASNLAARISHWLSCMPKEKKCGIEHSAESDDLRSTFFFRIIAESVSLLQSCEVAAEPIGYCGHISRPNNTGDTADRKVSVQWSRYCNGLYGRPSFHIATLKNIRGRLVHPNSGQRHSYASVGGNVWRIYVRIISKSSQETKPDTEPCVPSQV